MGKGRLVVALVLAGTMSSIDRPGFSDERTVDLLFNDPLTHTAPGDRCADEICTRLLELIRTAETSVDFAVYGMRHQTQLLEALEAAQARGVVVRGVVDRTRNGSNYYSSTDLLSGRLGSVRSDFETERALDTEFPSKFGNRIMHNKFFVVDERWVWTGSANISNTGTGGYNANVVAVVNSPQLAEVYSVEFEQMWEGRFHQLKKSDGIEQFAIGETDVAVWFSPQDGALRRGVHTLISGARHSINLAIFYLTDKDVAHALIAARERDVDVRVVIDATAARSEYSKHEHLREAGIPVKVENWGSKMHMKAAAIDDRTVVVGSMNWSFSGDKVNDENTLVLHSPRLAAEFESFFERLWDSIPQEWGEPGRHPDPESWESSTACTDGIDNDFDKLIDAQDQGCGEGA